MRYRVLPDDFCHEYLIQVGDEAAFEQWVEYHAGESTQVPDRDFSDYRLNKHLSCLSFTDPSED